MNGLAWMWLRTKGTEIIGQRLLRRTRVYAECMHTVLPYFKGDDDKQPIQSGINEDTAPSGLSARQSIHSSDESIPSTSDSRRSLTPAHSSGDQSELNGGKSCLLLQYYYYTTTLLHYSITILLHYYITTLLHYYITTLLHYYITTLIHYYITILPHYYMYLLHYYTTTLLHYYNTTILDYYTTTLLHVSTTYYIHTPPQVLLLILTLTLTLLQVLSIASALVVYGSRNVWVTVIVTIIVVVLFGYLETYHIRDHRWSYVLRRASQWYAKHYVAIRGRVHKLHPYSFLFCKCLM